MSADPPPFLRSSPLLRGTTSGQLQGARDDTEFNFMVQEPSEIIEVSSAKSFLRTTRESALRRLDGRDDGWRKGWGDWEGYLLVLGFGSVTFLSEMMTLEK